MNLLDTVRKASRYIQVLRETLEINNATLQTFEHLAIVKTPPKAYEFLEQETVKEQQVLENKIEKRVMYFCGKSCPHKKSNSRNDKQATALDEICKTFSETGYVANKRDSLGLQCNPSDFYKQN